MDAKPEHLGRWMKGSVGGLGAVALAAAAWAQSITEDLAQVKSEQAAQANERIRTDERIRVILERQEVRGDRLTKLEAIGEHREELFRSLVVRLDRLEQKLDELRTRK